MTLDNRLANYWAFGLWLALWFGATRWFRRQQAIAKAAMAATTSVAAQNYYRVRLIGYSFALVAGLVAVFYLLDAVF